MVRSVVVPVVWADEVLALASAALGAFQAEAAFECSTVVGRETMVRDREEIAAIVAAWRWFMRNQNKYDVPFSTIVMKVRAQCSSANVEHVKAEFARRHRRALQRGVWG